MAVSAVSVSMLLLVIATCRPAAGKYCSVFSLGIAAGTLMALYALFQMLAFVTVVIIEKTENDFGGERAWHLRVHAFMVRLLFTQKGSHYVAVDHMVAVSVKTDGLCTQKYS